MIWPQKGDRDLELQWHALLKQSSLTSNRRTQTVSLPPDDLFLASFFYYLFFTFAVKFHRRMKSFFFLLCDILKAGFSFCSLGETANALDETQKSLAHSLYG